MSPNPYAPPTADVADIAAPFIEKPRQVVLAIRILWVSLCIGIPDIVYQMFKTGAEDTGLFVAAVVVQAIVLALVGLLIVKIAAGRNWARIAFLTLVVLGVALMLLVERTVLTSNALHVVTATIQTLLEAVAMYLVFIGTGRHWFARRG